MKDNNYVCKIIEVTSAEYMHHSSKLKITTECEISAFLSMITEKYMCDNYHTISLLAPVTLFYTSSFHGRPFAGTMLSYWIVILDLDPLPPLPINFVLV